MNCDPLAYTGLGVHLGWLTTVAIVCVVAGALLLLLTRRRGRAISVALLLLVSGSAVTLTAATPQPAAADDCPPAHKGPASNSLTIAQTSVMVGLAPGREPVAITGIVSNNGTDSTDIVAIDVRITGVVPDSHAPPGACGPDDYLVHNRLMPVGRTLAPGGTTTFGGASIGLRNKSSNQDACKGATVELLYTANPS